MRIHLLAIGLIPFAASMVLAQPAELAVVLRDWEKAVSNAKDLSCEIQRTTRDKALKTSDKHTGSVRFLNDGKAFRVRYELFRDGTKELTEKFVVTKTDLFEYGPASKTVRVHVLPKDKKGEVKLPPFLSLITGADAAQRFDISLMTPDRHYHYLLIKPKHPDDKTEFRAVQLSLLRADNLPRQIRLLSSNSTEVTWNFTKVHVDSAFDKRLLDPDVKDWKVELVKPLLQSK